MKVTFPFMGPTFVYRTILERLGHEVIFPRRPSKKTIELGTTYAPEFACFPLKVLMGSYVESIERGAEAVITSGGVGPCRAGWYAALHDRILADMGYDVEFIILDPYWDVIKGHAVRLKGEKSWMDVVRATWSGVKAIKLYDELERRMQRVRVAELNRGETSEVWRHIFDRFMSLDVAHLKDFERESHAALSSVPVDTSYVPLRVGMVGEIYVLLEPSVNLGIEERLNYLGCVVERSIYLYEWLAESFLPHWAQPKINKDVLAKSKEYIPLCIGGHARQTVGATRHFADRGFDGVVHLMPFACTPEVVSSAIIPAISRQTGMPTVSFSIDEQTAETNVQTRLEAFVDLMRGRNAEAVVS